MEQALIQFINSGQGTFEGLKSKTILREHGHRSPALEDVVFNAH